MSGRLLGSVIVMWLLFAIAGVLNGVVRVYVLVPGIGEMPAHYLSTIILCAVILVGSYVLVKLQALEKASVLLQVGIIWLVATVIFEFIFGHYVVGHPWDRLLADYNVLQGRVWVLVLLAELFGPLLCARVRAGRRATS
ncbi:MAG: hypothetical protein ACOC9B_00460 [Chloroflexota bacterium]